VTLANAAIRARGNQDLRKSRVQDIQPPAGVTPFLTPGNGFGQRSMWPLPPVGEAQRRDPHVGDPVPNPPHPKSSQANASPPVSKVGKLAAGGGADANGFPVGVTYLKRIGSAVTRTLSRAYLAGCVDGQWRLGGVGMPFDHWGLGYGLGYQGDAQSLWLDNPQAFLRNPGIKPLTSVPATYRYVTLVGGAPVGPSIADVYNVTPQPTPATG
jgi:hypothetical protein